MLNTGQLQDRLRAGDAAVGVLTARPRDPRRDPGTPCQMDLPASGLVGAADQFGGALRAEASVVPAGSDGDAVEPESVPTGPDVARAGATRSDATCADSACADAARPKALSPDADRLGAVGPEAACAPDPGAARLDGVVADCDSSPAGQFTLPRAKEGCGTGDQGGGAAGHDGDLAANGASAVASSGGARACRAMAGLALVFMPGWTPVPWRTARATASFRRRRGLRLGPGWQGAAALRRALTAGRRCRPAAGWRRQRRRGRPWP